MKIGIIGAGKVGTAIAHCMRQKGLEVWAISDVSEPHLGPARTYLGNGILYTTENIKVVETSDVIAITTQDSRIKEIAQVIAGTTATLDGKVFFHTSGSYPSSILSPLKERGAMVGSFHPLQTFPDIESAIKVLSNAYIFIEGDEMAVDIMASIGKKVGYKVARIKGADKVLYHLSAVFVCNLFCALLFAGQDIMKRVGIGLEPFFPIIEATLKNIEQKGPLMSLTGPVVRGDVETVAAHIKAIEEMGLYKEIYRDLSLAALQMSEQMGALDEEHSRRLREILGDKR
jgi:predicted short-subunit dehydrogenase-like oxidoreductase (DUF2520 family)